MIRNTDQLKKKLHLMKMNLARIAGISEGMKVLDIGCGQGSFTACVAELVGQKGRVVGVDITDEYLDEMNRNLDESGLRDRVEFVKSDAAELSSSIDSVFDATVSYRLIEELAHPKKLPNIILEMAKCARQSGSVALIELSIETRIPAEENLIKLHRDIGQDYFPSPEKVICQMKNAGLREVQIKTTETDIWYSSDLLLKGVGSQDEVWPEFRKQIMEELWQSARKHGMKYPSINVFLGKR